MKITFVILLVTNIAFGEHSDSTRFSHSLMYSNYLSISLSAPHELNYQFGLRIKQKHQFNVRTGVYYFLYNHGRPVSKTIRERSFWVFPIFLGYQFSAGSRNQHRFKLDLGSKLISYEPSKYYSMETFFVNPEHGDAADALRKNLLMFLQLGYEHRFKSNFLLGGMFNGYITNFSAYYKYDGFVFEKIQPSNGLTIFGNNILHPNAKIYIGYEF